MKVSSHGQKGKENGMTQEDESYIKKKKNRKNEGKIKDSNIVKHKPT